MPSDSIVAFGPFRLDPRSRSLTRDGAPIVLGERAFDVLTVLAVADGQLVTKNALLEQVWSRVAVEENNLHAQVSALRKALGADAIATVPGRGYRLALRDGAAAVVAGYDGQAGSPALAVLPFACLAGSAGEQAFAHALAEELAAGLARIRSILVIIPSCEPADARQAARQLGVRYVVDGSVRSSAGRLRVLVRLCAAPTGLLLWAERFEGAAEDVFDLQDRVTGRVVAAIVPRIIAAEIAHAQRRQSGRPQPYDLLLQALSKYSIRTHAGMNEAVRLLRRAVAIDPGYALAHAHLANCLWWSVAQGWTHADDPALLDMLAIAQTAHALARDDAEVLLLVTTLVATRGSNLDGGITMIEKSLALNPSSAAAWRMLSVFQAYAGDTGASATSLACADRLNPLDQGPAYSHGRVISQFYAGDHEGAVESSRQLLLDEPRFGPALRYRAASLGMLGRVEEGREVVERMLVMAPDISIAWVRKHIEFDQNGLVKTSGALKALYQGLRRVGVPEA